MKIIKRNGLITDFNPSKILTRIKKAGKGLKVDADELFLKVSQGMADDMTTKEMDNLISRVAAGMTMVHPDYSKLAANICVSRHHKETSGDFLKTVKDLYYEKIVTEKFKDKVKDNIDEIVKAMDYNRDFNFDYFGWSTLEEIYLLKHEETIYERPQDMYMRVAVHLNDTIEDILAYYESASTQKISPATPILLNSGTKNGSLISCFHEDTDVFVKNRGTIKIKDVIIGDEIITHNNNLKKVSNVWVNPREDRDLIKFKVYQTPSIISTENHEFFSITQEQIKWNKSPKFNSISNLRVGDYIKSSSLKNYDYVSCEVIDLLTIINNLEDKNLFKIEFDNEWIYPKRITKNGSGVALKSMNKFKRFLNFDESFVKLLGLWYGDGTLIKSKGNILGVGIIAHTRQTEIISFIENNITKYLGIEYKKYLGKHTRNDSSWYQINIHSSLMGRIFENLFGSYYHSKKLYSGTYNWDKNLIISFLSGIINSDGYVTSDGKIGVSLKNNKLVKDMYNICRQHDIEVGYKDTKNCLKTLWFGKNDLFLNNISKFYSDDRLSKVGEIKKGRHLLKINGDYYYKILSKNYIESEIETVYNLEVEDDHSYNVSGLIAKNCNLTFNIADSSEGLLQTFTNICNASSASEGIGLAMHNIRSKESYVGSNGKAGGLLKYAKVVNDGMRFWNQKGKRPGACAIYLETWHKDILDILDIRKNTGIDEERARDLFLALWISDNFMQAVEEKKDWYLFCPNDIKKAGLKPFYEIYGEEFEIEYNKAVELGIGKTIKAQELWVRILDAQMETGVPYMLYKDAINMKSAQKNIGTIKSSNLCLDGNTILDIKLNGEKHTTDLKTVIDLFKSGNDILVKSFDESNEVIEYMKISNGGLMNKSAEVIKIIDEDSGKELICTPEHKVYTLNRGYVLAKDLESTDELKIFL